MSIDKSNRLFQILYTILLVGLAIAVPLLFTKFTRSVFEVNKMLAVRLFSITMLVVWGFQYVLYRANAVADEAGTWRWKAFAWRRVGLEIPVLIWIGFNVISTLFSQNPTLSIIGCYDRWEGLITIINYMLVIYLYAKLLRRNWQLMALLIGIVASTALSGVYGVFQSLGKDFMNWSVDPTMRVFACINNPVHYCAYVGMVVPIVVGWLLYYASDRHKGSQKALVIKTILFLAMLLIYYNQFLSYSRATWMGFVAAMTLFYLMVLRNIKADTFRSFLTDMISLTGLLGAFYLVYIFHLHEKGFVYAMGLFAVVIAMVALSLWNTLQMPRESLKRNEILLYLLGACVSMYFGFLSPPGSHPVWLQALLYPVGAVTFLLVCRNAPSEIRQFLLRLVIVFLFAKLQFVAISSLSVLQYGVMIGAYFMLSQKTDNFGLEKKFWLLLCLIAFGVVIAAPAIPSYVKEVRDLFSRSSAMGNGAQGLKVVENATEKVESYQDVAIKGTARTSMWKSSLPWIKDYWLLGSGPDTVKYMYPKYRRPEYGILEGGHNFTPDRLHNEYLNTLATRGFVGGLIYYVGVVLGWYYLLLRGFFKMGNSRHRYILAGLMASATVYLGQVMFNFGVVATLFLFYMVMGIALAMINSPDFLDDNSDG